MSLNGNIIPGESQATTSLRERFSQYTSKWPLFLVCVIVCLGLGALYARYTAPKYMASTSFLVKQADNNTSSSSDDLIKSVISGKTQSNLNDDILQIGSLGLMERTVSKNDFNISYYKKGRILNIELYKESPVRLVVKKLMDSSRSCTLYIKNLSVAGGEAAYDPNHPENTEEFYWGKPFTASGQTFVLVPHGKIISGDGGYLIKYEPVPVVSSKLISGLFVKTLDNQSNAILLQLKTENLQKGVDILNALFNEFNISNVEDRNKLSAATVQFIDERLASISEELNGVEGNLENYQGNNQLVDIKGQSSLSLENSSNVSKTIKELAVQKDLVNNLQSYMANSSNSNKLVPSSLGLTDATLNLLISQYNELQLKRERESPLVAPNSTVMQDINTQLSNLKTSLVESLNNLNKNIIIQQNSFQGQNSQYKNFLSSVPHNERVLQEIKRKQGITEGLYLYLLQKREEAAISSTASSVAHYIQIDAASGYGPVEPNERGTLIYSGFLGLFLAFGWIYLAELFNDKITSRQYILRKINLPIIGEISHLSKKKRKNIVVLERSISSEQFRALRTNLSFLLDKNHKTILVTSSMNSEGKSFISLNLAVACAIPGKKVALLEFDIRKPVMSTNLDLDSEKGLTDYLTGKENDLSQIYQGVQDIPTLHIYTCGQLPTNPGDLLLNDRMSKLFDLLKQEYDYIIIDSPPAKLVSDSFILGKYSDIVIYILRHMFTSKGQIDFINEIIANKTLLNIKIVYNAITIAGRNANEGYYGYAKPSI
jgi:capsular exopolysaccharide synthesis family protein